MSAVTRPEDQRSDTELVAAVNAGNWPAFDAIYFRHRDWVYRLGWRFCGDAEDAQDVVQEVFVYLAGKFPGLDLRVGMRTLLYPAVKHTAIAIRKKRRRMKALSENHDPTAPPTALEPAAIKSELAGILRGLTEEHREVLLMRFVDDMTLEEIASALAIPLGTAKSRLHHALRRVREDPRAGRYFEA